ncbi:fatty acid-binding protein, liver-like isoform X1 [Mytilus californianus]|uniref:fatty acid-binding protein, liver-like isoform X1 n=1 Tax=Mytilus californianus TaxID=6549 RepID=UPI0022456533|nr:fatty acid-binding protein, liver-like isoform X1 [Mytilus californianus]
MAQFVGKWKTINSTRKNYEEYCSSSGIPKDLVDKYREVVTVMDMEQKGDKWLITYDTGLGPPQSFTFILGQELVTKDLEGKGVKATATLSEDGIWTDKTSHEIMGYKETITTKRVEGNKMIASTTCGGVTMTYELEKQ